MAAAPPSLQLLDIRYQVAQRELKELNEQLFLRTKRKNDAIGTALNFFNAKVYGEESADLKGKIEATKDLSESIRVQIEKIVAPIQLSLSSLKTHFNELEGMTREFQEKIAVYSALEGEEDYHEILESQKTNPETLEKVLNIRKKQMEQISVKIDALEKEIPESWR